MKVLVLPFSLQIGGSEINAVELAAAVHELGHEVLVFGQPGPVSDIARDRGLRVTHASSSWHMRPSPFAGRELRAVLARERPDIVHAYEAFASTEAYYAAGVRRRVPLVGTVYGMSVDRYLPTAFPVIAGTEELRAELLRRRPAEAVFRLDPPVDVTANRPGDADGRRFRAAHGIGEELSAPPVGAEHAGSTPTSTSTTAASSPRAGRVTRGIRRLRREGCARITSPGPS